MALTEEMKLAIKITAQDTTKQAFNQMNQSLNGLKNTALAVAGAVGGALAFREVLATTRRLTDEIDLLRDELGLTAGQASRFHGVLQTFGVDSASASRAFGNLTNKVVDAATGNKEALATFQKFGIAFTDVGGAILHPLDLMNNVSDVLSKMPAGWARSNAAMEIFGERVGRKMLDVLTATPQQIKQVTAEMREWGALMDDETLDDLENFTRQTNMMNLGLDRLKLAIGRALIPVIRDLMTGLRQGAGIVKAFGEALRAPLGIIKEVVERIRAFVGMVKEGDLFGALKSLAEDLISKIGEILGNVGSWVSENFGKWREALGQLFAGMTEWIRTTGWPAFVSFMETQAPALAAWITSSLPTWTTNFAALIRDVLQWWIATGLPTLMGGLGTASSQIGQWLLDAIDWMFSVGLPQALSTLNAIGAGVKDGILSGLGDLIRSMGFGWFLDAIGWISAVGIPMALDTLNAIGGAISQGIADGMGNLKMLIWNLIKNAIPGLGPITDLVRGVIGAGSPPDGGTATGGGKSWSLIPPDLTPGGAIDLSPLSEQQRLIREMFPQNFAHGGIVTRPTNAIIGEAGPEAVIPLGRGGGWGGMNITVNVSGNVTRSEQELAEVVASHIVRRMRGVGQLSGSPTSRGTFF